MHRNSHSSYLKDVFSQPSSLAETVRRSANCIRQYELKFKYIACRGVSGITIGAPLAIRMRKSLMVVRKETENSHASTLVEGSPVTGKVNNFIIVDDFVSTGKTIVEILRNVKYEAPELNCLGVWSYHRLHESWLSLDVLAEEYYLIKEYLNDISC